MSVQNGMFISYNSNVFSTIKKMARFIFAISLAIAVLAVAAGEELYSDIYDDINTMEIIENDRLRDQYYKCFMDTAPCVTADAKYFKGNFPEAIVTKCRKCTEKQKENFGILVSWYTENRPEEWEALVAKFIEDARKMNISN